MSLNCPRCRTVQLDEIEVEDVIIDRCPRCAGLWFDHAEMGQIVGRVSQAKSAETDTVSTEHRETEIPCPHCGDIFLRQIQTKGSGERGHIVFRCLSCLGSWMDRGQLAAQEDPHLGARLKELFADSFPNEEPG